MQSRSRTRIQQSVMPACKTLASSGYYGWSRHYEIPSKSHFDQLITMRLVVAIQSVTTAVAYRPAIIIITIIHLVDIDLHKPDQHFRISRRGWGCILYSWKRKDYTIVTYNCILWMEILAFNVASSVKNYKENLERL